MLVGTGDPATLSPRAPRMDSLEGGAVTLPAVEIARALFELRHRDLQALLPPALHPTLPPLVSFTIWRCRESPWGAFQLAQTQISCRSGVRPRVYLVSAAIDGPEAAARALASRWGFTLWPARIRILRRYDAVSVQVERATPDAPDPTGVVLALTLSDPEPLAPGDVQLTAGMHPAQTRRGARLVQVDTEVRISRAERSQPFLEAFDPAAWGEARLAPATPVSAAFLEAEVILPRLRYVCRPDELAFTGTEVL